METTISITGLTQYGANGWEWTETTTGPGVGYIGGVHPMDVVNPDTRTITCRTNDNGEGLWTRRGEREYKQVSGTSQYRLPRSKSAAYAKIRRAASAEWSN